MNVQHQLGILKPGHYYGNMARSRQTSEVLLTEAIYPAGHYTPAHVHERAYFSLALPGSNDTIDTASHRTSETLALMFHTPGAPHSGQVREKGGRSFFVEISPALFERVSEHLKFDGTSIAFYGGLSKRLLARLYREFRRTDLASEIAIEGLVLEMLAQCSRDGAKSTNRRTPRFVTKACEIIHEHYADRLSLSAIAKLVEIHPVYLATEFRRRFHCSVGDYIRRVRIDAACCELAKSCHSIAEIGATLGFSHQAHFARTFKNHVGLTPSEYRRENTNKLNLS